MSTATLLLCAAALFVFSGFVFLLGRHLRSNDHPHDDLLGVVREVANTERRFGSAASYIAIRVLDGPGPREIFLTTNQYEDAVKLAESNPEDLISA